MAKPLTYYERMLRQIRAAIEEAITSGTHSATIGAAGGSESYTRLSLAQLRDMEAQYIRRVDAERKRGRFHTYPDFGARRA